MVVNAPPLAAWVLYSAQVVAAVDGVTRRGHESYEEFVQRAAADPLARIVKIADLHDNMNLSRIANPTEKDYARMERYRRALAVLGAE